MAPRIPAMLRRAGAIFTLFPFSPYRRKPTASLLFFASRWLGRFYVGDMPRVENPLDIPRTRYVVSYLQASKERKRQVGLRKGLCANNYTGRKGKGTKSPRKPL